MSHAPGPWIVCSCCGNDSVLSIEQDREQCEGEPSIIGEIDLMGDGIDNATGTANAELIAASPIMLDALKRALHHLRQINTYQDIDAVPKAFAISAIADGLRAAGITNLGEID